MAVIQMRRGPAVDWTSANPVLASGEFGYETDTNKFKIGDGSTVWNSLAYFTSGGTLGREVRGGGSYPYSYIGTAPSGSAEGSSVWTITRITLADSGSVTTGVATSASWTNRANEVYV